MSQNRVQKLVKIINKTAKKAGDSDLDLNRNEVETERQKMMKTFKEFVEAVTPSRLEKGENYGSEEYQRRLTQARQKEEKEKEQQRQATSAKLYKERTEGRGIRATQGGVKGWIKGGKFTPGNW
jgi:deoxyribodipyrimidine photolyase